MSGLGHNERSYRLDVLAGEARKGLENVEKGEEFTIGGWLAYGFALNEGRALHPGDREFGEWVAVSQLDTPDRMDRAAAMWAAANADQFEEARQRGNPRTIRGIHAKWKEIEAEREAARLADEASQRKAEEQSAAQDRAEAARSEVTAKVEAEGVALKAAASEKDEVAKRAAEERAAKATEEREAAEEAAKEAAQMVGQTAAETPAQEPDPHAAARKDIAKLSREGLEDEVIGLREENAELRSRVAAQRSQIADLKARLKDFDGDQAGAIRRLQAAKDQAGNARWRAEEELSAWKKQVYALKKRVSELSRQSGDADSRAEVRA